MWAPDKERPRRLRKAPLLAPRFGWRKNSGFDHDSYFLCPLQGERGDEPRPDVYFLAACLAPPRSFPPQDVEPARARDIPATRGGTPPRASNRQFAARLVRRFLGEPPRPGRAGARGGPGSPERMGPRGRKAPRKPRGPPRRPAPSEALPVFLSWVAIGRFCTACVQLNFPPRLDFLQRLNHQASCIGIPQGVLELQVGWTILLGAGVGRALRPRTPTPGAGPIDWTVLALG